MGNDLVFTGNIKADKWLCFSTLAGVAASVNAITFFHWANDLRKGLSARYDIRTAHAIVAAAYAVLDERGNSLLSLAYEAKNADVVNIVSSHILAHGMENDRLYAVLLSPKVLMLNRQIGSIGNFSRNLNSIYNQITSADKKAWANAVASAYHFISVPAGMFDTMAKTEAMAARASVSAKVAKVELTWERKSLASRAIITLARFKKTLVCPAKRG